MPNFNYRNLPLFREKNSCKFNLVPIQLKDFFFHNEILFHVQSARVAEQLT